ncbi:MAG: hypothetical protein Q4E13_08775 [Clostridia bacterium]|nr:hypothetical protein [Clostridia bacterium]
MKFRADKIDLHAAHRAEILGGIFCWSAVVRRDEFIFGNDPHADAPLRMRSSAPVPEWLSARMEMRLDEIFVESSGISAPAGKDVI